MKVAIVAAAVAIASPAVHAGTVSFVPTFDPDSEWIENPETQEFARQFFESAGEQIRSNGDDVVINIYLTNHTLHNEQRVEVVFQGLRYTAPSAWVKIVLGHADLSGFRSMNRSVNEYDFEIGWLGGPDTSEAQLRFLLAIFLTYHLTGSSWSELVLPEKDVNDVTIVPTASRIVGYIYDRYLFDANDKPLFKRLGTCIINDHRAINRRSNKDWDDNSSGFYFEGLDDFGNPVKLAVRSTNRKDDEGYPGGYINTGDLLFTDEFYDADFGEYDFQEFSQRKRAVLRGLGYQIVHQGTTYGREMNPDPADDTDCGNWRNIPPTWSVDEVADALGACDGDCSATIAGNSGHSVSFVNLVDKWGPDFGFLLREFFAPEFANRLGTTVVNEVLSNHDSLVIPIYQGGASGAGLVWRTASVLRSTRSNRWKRQKYRTLAKHYDVSTRQVRALAKTIASADPAAETID